MGSIRTSMLVMGYTLDRDPGRSCGICQHGMYTSRPGSTRDVVDSGWRCLKGDFWVARHAHCREFVTRALVCAPPD